jgi:putative hydrolase of the HAD superfamily
MRTFSRITLNNKVFPYNSVMAFTTLFFDLDETLYPKGSGLWEAIRVRMSGYMMQRLDLPYDEVEILRRKYFEQYGTTLRGLQIHHQVDADEYLAYVHDLPLANYLEPAPQLHELLTSLPQRKWIFTNADAAHARRVLAELGLAACFDGIADIRAMDFVCKPEVEAYYKALAQAGAPDPVECVLLDDSPRNLAPALALGFTTVLVGTEAPHLAASVVLPSLMALPRGLPELWQGRKI